MSPVERIPQARRCAARIQKENELAKLEYLCDLLRDRWFGAVTMLAKRRAGADPGLEREVRKWAAVIGVFETRIRRATSELADLLAGGARRPPVAVRRSLRP